MRLIDADALPTVGGRQDELPGLIVKAIQDAPTIDAVPVVRCKDCLWRHDSLNCNMYSEGMDPPGNWYCADGDNKYYKDDPSHPFADDVMMGE